MISLFCLEKEKRGGPIYLERFSKIINSECNTYINSSFKRNFFKFLLKAIFFKQKLIIANGILGIPLLLIFFYFKKKITIIHTPIKNISKKSKFLINIYLKLNRDNKLIFVANHIKENYLNEFKKDNIDKRSIVIYGPSTYLAPAKIDYKKISKTKNCVNLIFVGGESPEKGLFFCMSLLKELNKSKSIKYKLHVFGKIKKDLKSYKNLINHQFQENPFFGFNNMNSIHLMPSKYEGMPLSFIDSLSNQIPTILNDIEASQELKKMGIKSATVLKLNVQKWASLINKFKWDAINADALENDYKLYNKIVEEQLKIFIKTINDD